MKKAVLIFWFLFSISFAAWADRKDVIATNPQKTVQIQRRQIGSNQGGDPQYIDFIDLKSGRIISSFSSIWRSTDGGWSPDGLSACINDRTVTSGDFLYIFRLTNGHLTSLRVPSDDTLSSTLLKLYEKLKSSGRFTLTGKKWLSNESLELRVTGGGYGDDLGFDIVADIDRTGHVAIDPATEKIIK